MKTELMTITPEIAKQMLLSNGSNRRLRAHRVSKYANDMRNGNWHLTGQTITFGSNGQLLDGQHRLAAVIEADVPVQFLVVTGAEVVPTYDNGLPRSLADQLYLNGCNYPVAVMSTNGISVIRDVYSITHFGVVKAEAMREVTTDDLNNFIIENLDDMDWLCAIAANGRHANQRGLNRAVVFATLYCIHLMDPMFTRVRMERFIDVFRKGMMSHEEESPIIAVRNRFLGYSFTNSSADAREQSYRIMYAVSQYLKGTKSVTNRVPSELPYDFNQLIK